MRAQKRERSRRGHESCTKTQISDCYTTKSLICARPSDGCDETASDPEGIVREAMRRLESRGHRLPAANRLRYISRVILGEFCARWHKKHAGKTVAMLAGDRVLEQRELRPFLLALVAAGDETAFRRVTPRMARQRTMRSLNMDLGSADDFTGFVASNTEVLADRFLANFDSNIKNAAQKAVRYIQVTAVSYYLTRRTRPIRTEVPNLKEYLRLSNRLRPRTVLAVKLAYLPALLTADECRRLRREYGWEGPFRQTIPIKTIAERLRFKNPDTLYRKLYRVRAWCRSYISDREARIGDRA